jgi:hypothetical protein
MRANILQIIRQIATRAFGISPQLAMLQREIDEAKILAARVLINQIESLGLLENIQDAEFKVFSQWGDDGIIQYLVQHLEIEPKTFIEFGVQNYRESNTRFLLMNNNWTGLVIDGCREYIDYIVKDDLYWRYDLTAVCAFVGRENINNIFAENGFEGKIGILSIDIDGNDYWIWNSINAVEPVLVIVEYNSSFGDQYAITIPYEPKFNRTQAHYSNLYWGASLKALCLLAEKKGYEFIGSNSSGNNAYFVRKDRIGKLRKLSAEQGYVRAKYRESRDRKGRLTYISGDECLKIIGDMSVYDIERDATIRIKDLFGNIGNKGAGNER